LFHEFAVTLSAAILVSGVVSLTLTPMLCGRFLKRDEPHSHQGRVSAMSERAFNAMHQFYERTLKWVLDREAIMLIVTLVVIVATVGLYYYIPKGFFPQQDTGQLMGTTEAAQDISFAAMKEKQEQVVQTVMQDPAVQAVGSFFGGGTGSA
jgi:multidrug efflux pump